MASDLTSGARAAQPAAARKTGLLRRMLALSQQEVLLVELDGLAELLEEKERLIEEIRRVDEEQPQGEASLAAAEREEQGRLLATILENERSLEKRMDSERGRLKDELRALERETRLRRYLERPAPRRAKVDLKQ